jgi:hypothetical protein
MSCTKAWPMFSSRQRKHATRVILQSARVRWSSSCLTQKNMRPCSIRSEEGGRGGGNLHDVCKACILAFATSTVAEDGTSRVMAVGLGVKPITCTCVPRRRHHLINFLQQRLTMPRKYHNCMRLLSLCVSHLESLAVCRHVALSRPATATAKNTWRFRGVVVCATRRPLNTAAALNTGVNGEGLRCGRGIGGRILGRCNGGGGGCLQSAKEKQGVCGRNLNCLQ